MKSKTTYRLILTLVLMIGFLPSVQAVSDAELEALEKQIEQLEVEEKLKAEAETKRKAEEKRKAEAEAEAKRKVEQKRKAETEAGGKQLIELKQKRFEEEKRNAEEARLTEFERQRQEEETKKRVEEEFWTAIKNSDSEKDFEDYLSNYPNGRFVNIAKIKIRQLSKKNEILNETINYAKTANITASSFYSAFWAEKFPPIKIIDGDTNENCYCTGPCRSYWLLPNRVKGHIQLQLVQDTIIHKVKFLNTSNRKCNDRATLDYHIDVMTNENNVITVGRGHLQFTTNPQWQEISFKPFKAKSVIFYVDSFYDNGGGLNEIEIY